ncbi:transcriptional regulator [Nocardia sp. MDA0666]|uniref:ArsR/SmtB family transcription factor n=1 Tax=Nocardia sp. MDA0666 TaxID=2135448 RepID=UPI000D12D777|nr:metalloregulator ArsR/SmtB family transcription factor [Nocardia sp. MDA0666]PSR58912.1 transcriptional regulator [Nocardia sp. MDA0666]
MGTYQDGALDALGDPTRRAIFERLGRGPCAVGELAAELPVSRPAVSQHLKVLKQAGLVLDEAIGTRRIYRLDPNGIDALRGYFTRFWTTAMSSFRDRAEAAARAGQPLSAEILSGTTTSEEKS